MNLVVVATGPARGGDDGSCLGLGRRLVWVKFESDRPLFGFRFTSFLGLVRRLLGLLVLWWRWVDEMGLGFTGFVGSWFVMARRMPGVDFKIKLLTVDGKKLKLTIWDTAGQERFRTLTSSYYRGAQGIILVYDVTRRETFTNLSDVWAKEVELYSTNQDCVKILVGNKVDRESDRAVSRDEGIALAKELGSMFLECSAKTRENVEQCFEELALKVFFIDNPRMP
uniref:Ras-related protein RABC2a n=1 Tax=Cannabis sativa TaxID=3483 RepID=A0A803PAU6_CANSA